MKPRFFIIRHRFQTKGRQYWPTKDGQAYQAKDELDVEILTRAMGAEEVAVKLMRVAVPVRGGSGIIADETGDEELPSEPVLAEPKVTEPTRSDTVAATAAASAELALEDDRL